MYEITEMISMSFWVESVCDSEEKQKLTREVTERLVQI
jgi:hypothetical protein